MCNKNKVKAEKRFACLMQPLGKLFGGGEGNLLCRASQPPHVGVGIKGCARMFPTVDNSSELVHDSDNDAPKRSRTSDLSSSLLPPLGCGSCKC